MKKISVTFVETLDQSSYSAKTLRRYTYYTTLEDLKPGDLLVAPAKNTYAVVKFEEYIADSKTTVNITRTITQRVDTESHKEAEQLIAKKAAVKMEMMARKSKLEEEAIYVLLAEKDPKMKELLDLYNSMV